MLTHQKHWNFLIYKTYNFLKNLKLYVFLIKSLSEYYFAFIFIVLKPQKDSGLLGVYY